MIGAISSSPGTLENLKCLRSAIDCEEFARDDWADVAGGMITDWLLQEAPSLERLTLDVPNSILAATATSFKFLKHLQLKSDAIACSHGGAVRHLPAMEILHIDKVNDTTVVAELDLSRCSCLRRLATGGLIAERLLIASDCRVSFGAGSYFLEEDYYQVYHRHGYYYHGDYTEIIVESATQDCMWLWQLVCALFFLAGCLRFRHCKASSSIFPRMELLSMWWPGDWGEEEMPIAETETLLCNVCKNGSLDACQWRASR